MAKNIAEIILKLDDRISKGLGAVNDKLYGTSSALKKIEDNAKTFEKLRKGALITGTAIAAGLGIATAKAVQFQSSLAPVKTVLSGTADEVQQASERIGKHALSWSTKYKNSSEEYLGASYNLLSAGLNEQQAIAGTNQALKLATATLGDASTASALLGTLYNNFGNKAGDANLEMMRLSDTVAKTQQLFQIANLNQLNEGLKHASSSALAFNVSFAQTSAVVGQLNTLGITGSMAGTSFNAMMGKLSKGSKDLGYEIARTSDGGLDLVKTLRNISNVGADADTIKKVFGEEGAKGITLLTAKLADLESNFSEVQGCLGATEEAFKKMTHNSAYQLGVLQSNFAVFGTSIGKPMESALLGFLLAVNPVLARINELFIKHEWLAKIFVFVSGTVAALALGLAGYVFWMKSSIMVLGYFSAMKTLAAAAAGKFALVMGGVVNVLRNPAIILTWAKNLWAMNTAILANPIGLVIAAAIGLLAALMMNIDWVINGWDSMISWVKNLGGVFEWLGNIADFVFGTILRQIKWIVDKFKELFGFTGQAIPEMPEALETSHNVQQKITPSYETPKGLEALSYSAETVLPNTHNDFLEKNGITAGVSSAGSIGSAFASERPVRKSTSDIVSSQTIINIDKVEVADGVINDVEDFILQLRQRVVL